MFQGFFKLWVLVEGANCVSDSLWTKKFDVGMYNEMSDIPSEVHQFIVRPFSYPIVCWFVKYQRHFKIVLPGVLQVQLCLHGEQNSARICFSNSSNTQKAIEGAKLVLILSAKSCSRSAIGVDLPDFSREQRNCAKMVSLPFSWFLVQIATNKSTFQNRFTSRPGPFLHWPGAITEQIREGGARKAREGGRVYWFRGGA